MEKEEEKRKQQDEEMRKKVGESRIEPLTEEELEVENGFFTVGGDSPLIKVSGGEEEKTENNEGEQ